MRGRLPDPAWKSGPPDPSSPTADRHALWDEPAMDMDGVGVREAEEIDGEPLCAVREARACSRDGCDGEHRKVHLYRLEDVPDEVFRALTGPDTAGIEPAIVLGEAATVVEHDGEEAYIGFETPGETVGYVAPCRTIDKGEPGPCYGYIEPDPEPYGL